MAEWWEEATWQLQVTLGWHPLASPASHFFCPCFFLLRPLNSLGLARASKAGPKHQAARPGLPMCF